jgi:hypothetical protein
MSSSADPEDKHLHNRRAQTSASVRDDGFHDGESNGGHRKQGDGPQNSNSGRHTDKSSAYENGRPTVAGPGIQEVLAADPKAARQTVVAREKEQFGGIKVGAAFFGWLTATGMAVLLTALASAAGTAVGLATDTTASEATEQAANETVGIIGVVILLLILFLAYYSGGYVAGRMARFNGIKQGVMVWIWAVIAAIVVAVVAGVAGQRFNILATLNSFPRIPVNEGQLSAMGLIAALVVAAVSLVAAALGGLGGMRFHRRVDRAGFTQTGPKGARH